MKVNEDAKTAIDQVNKEVAVLDGKKLYLFSPNKGDKKPEKIKLNIEEPSEIAGFETFADGYFIQGINEYIFLNKSAEVVSSNYFKQLKTDRLLKAALYSTSTVSGVMSTEVTMTDSEGQVMYEGGLFINTESARAMGEISKAQRDAINKLRDAAKLRGASSSNRDYAFFLKGENTDAGDKMSIVKIEKKSGKEVDSFYFGNDRKVVYQLDKTGNKLYFLTDDKLNVFDL